MTAAEEERAAGLSQGKTIPLAWLLEKLWKLLKKEKQAARRGKPSPE